MDCIICGDNAEEHHLKTRKAHPELEHKDFNKIPVCRTHHRMFHDKGTNYMAANYYAVLNWLSNHNWSYDDVTLRWEHYEEL